MLGQNCTFHKGGETITGMVLDKVRLPLRVQYETHDEKVGYAMLAIDHYVILSNPGAVTHYVAANQVQVSEKTALRLTKPNGQRL